MKKSFYAFILLCMPFTIFSQLDTIDISNYYLPDLSYKKLTVGFGLYSQGYYSQQVSYSHEFQSLSKGNDSRLSLSSNYRTYQNSRKLQKENYSSISFKPDFYKKSQSNAQSNDIRDTSTVKFLAPIRISTQFSRRYYYKPKKFYEFNFNLSNEESFEFTRIRGEAGIEKNNYFNSDLYFTPDLLIGFGRVEDVTEMWHTVRMFEEFKKQGLLLAAPEMDQLLSFANLLAERKNNRYYDGRLERLADLDAIDQLIADDNLVNNSGLNYYNTLLDMWYYGADERRLAGQSIAFGLTNEILLDYGNSSKYNDRFTLDYGTGIKAKYRYHKPINQEWQLDAGVQISALYDWNINLFGDISFDNSHITLLNKADISLGWYPNTRTYLSSSLGLDYRHYYHPENHIHGQSMDFVTYGSWRNYLYYYLSPKSRLSANFNLYCRYSARHIPDVEMYENNNKRFNYALNIGYSYAIF